MFEHKAGVCIDVLELLAPCMNGNSTCLNTKLEFDLKLFRKLLAPCIEGNKRCLYAMLESVLKLCRMLLALCIYRCLNTICLEALQNAVSFLY